MTFDVFYARPDDCAGCIVLMMLQLWMMCGQIQEQQGDNDAARNAYNKGVSASEFCPFTPVSLYFGEEKENHQNILVLTEDPCDECDSFHTGTCRLHVL